MILRTLAIGPRLAAGMGAILLVTAALLGLALAGSARDLAAVGETLKTTATRAELIENTHQALLRAQLTVRNVGLQSEVDGVNAAEQVAKRAQADYLEHRRRLEAEALDAEGAAQLARLVELDGVAAKLFDSALGLAQQFNTEQAAAIIARKIDPLTGQAEAALAKIASLQRDRAVDAQQQAERRARRNAMLVVGVAIAGLAASAALAWALARSIVAPLQQAVAVAERVASGDLSGAVPTGGRDEPAQLLAALERMNRSLADVVGKVRANSDGIAAGSAQIATGNADLSHRTETQAASLQQTAFAMQKLGEAVGGNARNAREADGLARAASGIASEGGEVFSRMVETMRGISESSRRIADIIGTIDGIAFQTNILALNAAVEAARAGEQGRGFAVVASEVRTLAQNSAAAAREIKQLIAASTERVEQGSALVEAANGTVERLVGSIARVGEMIGAISEASAEQSANVDQVGSALVAMDGHTQQNAALVEESAAAAESLRRQSEALVESVAVFRIGRDG
ncbi:MAG TPA: methyl-accepting chemotaxis protein [Burkholderiaceae bacterium]|nr:methyl-accepting chemotaxis protein [Burkholderiaceae bacterium]